MGQVLLQAGVDASTKSASRRAAKPGACGKGLARLGFGGHGMGRRAESATGSGAKWIDNYLIKYSVPNLHGGALGWIDSKKE